MTIIFYDMSRKKRKNSVFISDAVAASALTAAAMFIESPSDICSVLGIFFDFEENKYLASPHSYPI